MKRCSSITGILKMLEISPDDELSYSIVIESAVNYYNSDALWEFNNVYNGWYANMQYLNIKIYVTFLCGRQ
jgi:hypothetical protein